MKNDYERTACQEASDATEAAISDVQDSDIVLRLEEAAAKIREAWELAEERA